MNFNHVTTQANADAFDTTRPVFVTTVSELRELSKKKPDALITGAKLEIINRVLVDLLAFLRHEPESKYLYELDVNAPLQVSDALLQMSQFEVALDAFRQRYTEDVDDEEAWVTPENISCWHTDGILDEDEDADEEDDEDDEEDDQDDEDWEDGTVELPPRSLAGQRRALERLAELRRAWSSPPMKAR